MLFDFTYTKVYLGKGIIVWNKKEEEYWVSDSQKLSVGIIIATSVHIVKVNRFVVMITP